MGIFLGLSFGPGIFLGFVGSPRFFGGLNFCPHSIIPVTCTPPPPLPRGTCMYLFRPVIDSLYCLCVLSKANLVARSQLVRECYMALMNTQLKGTLSDLTKFRKISKPT